MKNKITPLYDCIKTLYESCIERSISLYRVSFLLTRNCQTGRHVLIAGTHMLTNMACHSNGNPLPSEKNGTLLPNSDGIQSFFAGTKSSI